VFSEVVLCVATNSRYTGVAVNSASVEWVVASHQRWGAVAHEAREPQTVTDYVPTEFLLSVSRFDSGASNSAGRPGISCTFVKSSSTCTDPEARCRLSLSCAHSSCRHCALHSFIFHWGTAHLDTSVSILAVHQWWLWKIRDEAERVTGTVYWARAPSDDVCQTPQQPSQHLPLQPPQTGCQINRLLTNVPLY
jgi:hypothetical protein